MLPEEMRILPLSTLALNGVSENSSEYEGSNVSSAPALDGDCISEPTTPVVDDAAMTFLWPPKKAKAMSGRRSSQTSHTFAPDVAPSPGRTTPNETVVSRDDMSSKPASTRDFFDPFDDLLQTPGSGKERQFYRHRRHQPRRRRSYETR